jgi:diguanylate cyclase (GGDEF)-like protein
LDFGLPFTLQYQLLILYGCSAITCSGRTVAYQLKNESSGRPVYIRIGQQKANKHMKRGSLKKRITSFVMQAVLSTLLISLVLVLVIENVTARKDLKREIDNLMSVVSRSVVPAMLFNDRREASATLATLSGDSRIIKAQLLNNNNSIYVEYIRQQESSSENINETFFSGVIERFKRSIAGDTRLLERDVITVNGEKIGELNLWLNRAEYNQRILSLIFSILGVGIFCSIVGVAMGNRLPRTMIKSVQNLENTFSNISKSNDYSQRAPDTKIIELDGLVSSFNVLIDKVRQREVQIESHRYNLALALDGSGEGIWSFDPAQNIFELDGRSCEIIGCQERMTFTQLLRFGGGVARKNITGALRDFHQEGKEQFEIECLVRRGEGHGHWIIVHGKFYVDALGGMARASGTLTDNNAQRKSNEESQLLAAVFRNTQEPVLVVDEALKIQIKNEAFVNSYRLARAYDYLSDLMSDKYPEHFAAQIISDLEQLGCWEGQIELKLNRYETQTVWLSFSAINSGDENQPICRYLGTLMRLDERERMEDKLRYFANYDSLTNLPNRRFFNEKLTAALSFAKESSASLGLLFIDINDFKIVNDQHGHAMGDELLKIIADRLQSNTQNTDVVARLGGDEFVILLDDFRHSNGISKTADRIISLLDRPFSINGSEIRSSASIGIAVFPNDGDNAGDLMRHADIAMYRAKVAGRSQYLYFDKKMAVEIQHYSRLKSDLGFAIERDELSIHLQPKFNLKTFEISSAEVLLRWKHPILGFVSPADFIPIAEESGRISEIGMWVVDRAIEVLCRWKGTQFSNLALAVNVSAKQFSDIDFIDHISELVAEHDIDPSQLDVEITESLLASSRDIADKFCKKIKNIGCSLSIDDFGTGYSSFKYLAELPLDILKIDRDFVSGIGASAQEDQVVEAMIGIAHSLNMQVVAEGIETEDELRFLQRAGCEYGQGYWCSKPLPLIELESFLTGWIEKELSSENISFTLIERK